MSEQQLSDLRTLAAEHGWTYQGSVIDWLRLHLAAKASQLAALTREREQSEQTDLVAAVTAIVRKADRDFERVGGSSRHWVRECFLPTLNAAGFLVTRQGGSDVLCRHCNEELRFIDGEWTDRETHTICLHNDKKHEPATAQGEQLAALRAALKKLTDHMDRAGGDPYGPECPWCKAGPDGDDHAANCELVEARALLVSGPDETTT